MIKRRNENKVLHVQFMHDVDNITNDRQIIRGTGLIFDFNVYWQIMFSREGKGLFQ